MINGMQPMVFEKVMFVFQEQSDNVHMFTISVHKLCDASSFSEKSITGSCSADKKLLIEAMMEEIETVILKGIESVYRLSRRFIQICKF